MLSTGVFRPVFFPSIQISAQGLDEIRIEQALAPPATGEALIGWGTVDTGAF
jgi:hypothetical protein